MITRTRIKKAEAAALASMTDAELEAIVGNADFSGFTDAKLQAIADGTAPAELVQHFEACYAKHLDSL